MRDKRMVNDNNALTCPALITTIYPVVRGNGHAPG